MPARVVKTIESRFNDQMGISDGTRTPSVSSYRSSSTRSRSTTHSRALHSRTGTRQLSTPDTDAPRIIELEDEAASHYGDNASNMNSTGHMYDMLQRQKNRLKQLTHTDDTVKDEFQLMKEEVDRAAEDLKGKNYIFDQDGQIVMIQPLKSDQLPPFALNPSLNVNNVDSTQHDDDHRKKSALSNAPLTKKKKKVRVAGTRGIDDPHEKALFTPTTSLATTIAGNSHEIQVNQGVAIETNKISKQGPPIPDDPRKPSRREYFNRKATAAASTSMDSTWGEENGNDGVRGDDSLHSNSMDGIEGSMSMTGGSSTLTNGNRFKDINPLEGGRPKPQLSMTAPLESSRSNVGSSRRPSQDNGKKGKQQPPLEPTKPSYQQQTTVNLLHGGNHMQGPRDRLPSQVLNTRAEKKRYVIPTKLGPGDDMDTQSYNSANSKKSTGTIKKERLAQALF